MDRNINYVLYFVIKKNRRKLFDIDTNTSLIGFNVDYFIFFLKDEFF